MVSWNTTSLPARRLNERRYRSGGQRQKQPTFAPNVATGSRSPPFHSQSSMPPPERIGAVRSLGAAFRSALAFAPVGQETEEKKIPE